MKIMMEYDDKERVQLDKCLLVYAGEPNGDGTVSASLTVDGSLRSMDLYVMLNMLDATRKGSCALDAVATAWMNDREKNLNEIIKAMAGGNNDDE